MPQLPTTKKNVHRFDEDVRTTGSYTYTADRTSAKLANARITAAISAAYSFSGKRVLDLGCGDGTYTVELAALGVSSALGIDPSSAAVNAATARALELGLAERVHFLTGNIYNLGTILHEGNFDVIVLRGVLHHLPEPARALDALANFSGSVLVLEPNGLNPVLKLLEKFSRYHIEHEERSFAPTTICRWLTAAGFTITKNELVNLVPMFCPGWMAQAFDFFSPIVERIPLMRTIACGQCLIIAKR